MPYKMFFFFKKCGSVISGSFIEEKTFWFVDIFEEHMNIFEEHKLDMCLNLEFGGNTFPFNVIVFQTLFDGIK